mgnify:CR=1 FL=1
MDEEKEELLENMKTAFGRAWDTEIHFIQLLKELREEVRPGLEEKIETMIEISEGRKRNYLRYRELVKEILEKER